MIAQCASVRSLVIFALVASGCMATTRHRVANPDSLDDDQLAATAVCRERCTNLYPDDESNFVDCWAQCPTVLSEFGTCADEESSVGLCTESRGYSRTATREAMVPIAFATAIIGTLAVAMAASDLGEALGDALLPPPDME